MFSLNSFLYLWRHCLVYITNILENAVSQFYINTIPSKRVESHCFYYNISFEYVSRKAPEGRVSEPQSQVLVGGGWGWQLDLVCLVPFYPLQQKQIDKMIKGVPGKAGHTAWCGGWRRGTGTAASDRQGEEPSWAQGPRPRTGARQVVDTHPRLQAQQQGHGRTVLSSHHGLPPRRNQWARKHQEETVRPAGGCSERRYWWHSHEVVILMGAAENPMASLLTNYSYFQKDMPSSMEKWVLIPMTLVL